MRLGYPVDRGRQASFCPPDDRMVADPEVGRPKEGRFQGDQLPQLQGVA
jgi:hypothetical protein